MLKISSKKTIPIPELLYNYLLLEEKKQAKSDAQFTGKESVDDSFDFIDDTINEKQNEPIQQAFYFYQKQEPERVIYYLAIFAKKEAIRQDKQGKTDEALAILIDAIILEYEGLEYARPHLAGKLIEQLSSLAEQALRIMSGLGALSDLTKLQSRITCLFDIIATVWEPNLKGIFLILKDFLDPLCQMERNEITQQRSLSRSLMDNLKNLKAHINETAKNRTIHPVHLDVLITLVDNWLQMVQQEILLVASAEYGSEGIDISIVAWQVQQLIGQVEKRLRDLIEKKYNQQFGESWVQHIASKHKNSYSYWKNNMSKDQSSFQQYNQYNPQILEYASTEDLRELITAQWHLFRSIFDFGYTDRNKAVFYDKMSCIIRVRNPLAHNRSIPENELLRAKVLCTDILLALDQAGEG